MDDHHLAAMLAEEAGRRLLALQGEGRLTGAALGAEGDRSANDYLMAALAEARPDDAILCEERADTPERLGARRVWVVDPLDGTREFSDGRDDWAVHVALTIDGKPVAGAVAVPARGRTWSTASARAPLWPDRRPIMLVSRTRCPEQAAALAAKLGAEMREMGSAGAKAMAVLAGEADLYFHTGGQNEWDNCAPAAVALAAGIHATRADGAMLTYNRENVLVPDLVIGRRDLAEAAVAFWRSLAG